MKASFVIPNRSTFVSDRRTILIEERIKIILWYVIECYLLTLKNNEKYSKTWVKSKTTIKFEDYLKIRLVEDYLNENKDLLKQKTPALNTIDFAYETNKEYIDLQNNKIKLDKIDIYVNKIGLQKEWQGNGEPYFAIECKRIEEFRDVDKKDYGYISDIQKFCKRSHIKTRLPFEGQIAFIENPSITHIQLKDKINEKLANEQFTITQSALNQIIINYNFDATYLSQHQHNSSRQNFSIYHLLFDYSNIVVN
jgi:hypothetical protein